MNEVFIQTIIIRFNFNILLFDKNNFFVINMINLEDKKINRRQNYNFIITKSITHK